MSGLTEVDDYIATLDHARLADIRTLRSVILSAQPGLSERIKWNAPSFCWEGEDRLTMRLHPGDRLDLILHRGAKNKDTGSFAFNDPTGRVVWKAPDRGVLTIGDPDIERVQIEGLVRDWILATE